MMTITDTRTEEYRCDYYFTAESDFVDKITHLLNQIERKEDVLRIAFFGETENTRYEKELQRIRELVAREFGADYPLISYITQPVLGGGTLAIEVLYKPDNGTPLTVEFRSGENVRYLVLESDVHKSVIIEGVRGATLQASIREQSDDIFRKIALILRKEGLLVSDIIRQWNYIGGITDFEGDKQNYQAFNDSRTLFYRDANWKENGYPAATGIGMGCAGVIVELIATRTESSFVRIAAIDNPLQIAAHNYSRHVLLGKEDERLSRPSTPKFERAKTVWTDKNFVCFISGTAAIRGEDSLKYMDVRRQTLLTMENVDYLISPQNQQRYGVAYKDEALLDSIRVYIKNPSDFDCVKEEIGCNWGDLPALYVLADVCREELLVEIEGIAGMFR